MDYKNLFSILEDCSMNKWAALLENQLGDYFNNLNHGDYPEWHSAVEKLPVIKPSKVELDSDSIVIGDISDCSDEIRQKLEQQLKVLMPWRKGPFNLFGTFVDSEWRSNLKWARLIKHIKPLADRLVLDIGCGNGYYAWRMLGNHARHIIGLDPTLLFMMQFLAVKKYVPNANIDILPFGIQKLPDYPLNFDTVFSMGVIYHRRDPVEHLLQLRNCLCAGGELVLESLIIESKDNNVLVPENRYAKMNNVWTIPNPELLLEWVGEAGFINARIIDITKTTSAEQRRTEWMTFESLSDFLDKEDSDKTVEGYPAPCRAILLAEKP